MEVLWMGSGWWTLAGLLADIIGFWVLATDLLPEFRIWRELQALKEPRRRILEEIEKAGPWAGLTEDERVAAEISTDRFMGGVPKAAHQPLHPPSKVVDPEVEQRFRIKQYHRMALRSFLEVGTLNSKREFPDVDLAKTIANILPETTIEQLDREISRLMKLTLYSKGSVAERLLWRILMVTSSVEMSQRNLNARPRPPLRLGIGLVIAGFVLQAWGSIPVDPPTPRLHWIGWMG